MIPDILTLCSELSLPELDKRTRIAADWVVRGLTTAPNLSPSAPCVDVLPLWCNNFMSHINEIANRRSLIPISVLRLEYHSVLDAIVAFVNSIWALEQREKFENCHCQHHARPEVRFYQYLFANDPQMPDTGSRPLFFILYFSFGLLCDLMEEMRKDQRGAVRLEKNPQTRRKWPSSPTKFLPNGASAAVSAFISWARLMEHPLPLRVLFRLTTYCPSLEREISPARSGELLPLVSTLFLQYATYFKRKHLGQHVNRRAFVESDISHFHIICSTNRFRGYISAARANRAFVLALTTIYDAICILLPLFDNFAPSFFGLYTKEETKDRTGLLGLSLYEQILSNLTPPPGPLHPNIKPFTSPEVKEKYSYCNLDDFLEDVLSLRNRQKCAQIQCTVTTESTRTNFKQCSKCHAAGYCSKECQAEDWKEHKPFCLVLKKLLPIALYNEGAENGGSPELLREVEPKISVALQELVSRGTSTMDLWAYMDARKRCVKAYSE